MQTPYFSASDDQGSAGFGRLAPPVGAGGSPHPIISDPVLCQVLARAASFVFAQDNDLRYIWIGNNPFGGDFAGFVGANDEAAFPEIDIKPIVELKRRALAAGTGLCDEVMVDWKGHPRHFRLYIEPRLDECGNATGIVGLMADITDAQHATRSFHEMEERVRLMSAATNDSFYDWRIDEDSGLNINEGDDTTQQLKSGALRWWAERVHPDDRDRLLTMLRSKLAGHGNYWMAEYRFRTADGDYQDILDRGFLLRDRLGRALRLIGVQTDISARRLDEKVARHRLSEIESLLRNIPDLVARFDRQLRYRYLNDPLLREMGLTRPAVMGKTPAEIGVPQPLAQRFALACEEVFETGEGRTLEFVFNGASGPRLYHMRIAPERNASGEVVSLLTVGRDLTSSAQSSAPPSSEPADARVDLVRAFEPTAIAERERLARESEVFQRLSRKLTGPLSFMEMGRLVARECHVLFQHDAFALSVYDSTIDSFVGMYNEDTPEGASEPIVVESETVHRKRMGRSRLLRGEPRLINRPAGGTDPSGINFVPFGVKGRLSKSLMFCPVLWQGETNGVLSVQSYTPNRYTDTDLGMLQALANHVAGAFARMRMEDALRRSEERFRRIYETSPAGIAMVRLENMTIAAANPAFCRITGFCEEDLRERCIHDMVHPADQDREREAIKAVMDGSAGSFELQVRYLRRDGVIIPAHVGASILMAGSSEPDVAIFVVSESPGTAETDTNRLKDVERTEFARKLESLSALSSGIAHDFNNLLVGILGGLALAQSDLPPASPARETLRLVEESASRAAALANRLLSYSGRGIVRFDTFDLAGLSSNSGQSLQVFVPPHIRLTSKRTREPLAVRGDHTQIEQALLELVQNSVEAIGDSPGTIRIETSTLNVDEDWLRDAVPPHDLSPGPYAVLTVVDNGPGMSSEVLSRIFEPFFTTRQVGRGLGLASVIGIVRGMKGGIRVQSARKEGTRFDIALPLDTCATVPDTEEEWTDPSDEQVDTNLTPATILVVDDEDVVRTVACKILERMGHTVYTARSGVEAMAWLNRKRRQVNAILMDHTMPGLTGSEFLECLRDEEREIPVILMSGFHELGTSAALARHGCSAFLQKPFRPAQLRDVVSRILRRAGTPR